MEIDSKLAQKVLDADLANMAKRVNEGKNLTANQRAHFMQATGQMPLPETGLAKNKVELAAILGVLVVILAAGGHGGLSGRCGSRRWPRRRGLKSLGSRRKGLSHR